MQSPTAVKKASHQSVAIVVKASGSYPSRPHDYTPPNADPKR